MSDDFIPLNQSTPTSGKWQGRNKNRSHNQRYHNQSGSGRGQNPWGNNSQRHSSFGSGSNSSSYGQDKNNIDAYLHPAMLQDPWVNLRRRMEKANDT